MRVRVWTLVLIVALAGCSWAGSNGSAPALSQPGGTINPVYLTEAGVPDNLSVTYGGIVLCISAPGNARIANVAIHDRVGDLRVEAFGVRPMAGHDLVGFERRPLSAIGDGFDLDDSQEVASVCPTKDRAPTWNAGIELAIQASRASGDIAYGSGVDITYEVDGREATYTVPFGIMLCASTCPKPPGW